LQDIYVLLLISVIGLGLRIGYNFYGLKLAPSINDLIISSTAPVFIVIGAIAVFHEKPKKKVIIGGLVSFLGVIVIILQPILHNGIDLSLIGNIFLMVAMALSVLYTLLLKELAPRYNPLTLLFWTFLIASFTLLPFAGYEIAKIPNIMAFSTKGLTGIIFSIFFCTLIAYSMNLYGLKRIKASEVGLFSYVDPFIGVAIASPLLGEHISFSFFVGSLMVFLGIYIAERRVHYHPVHLLKRKNEALAPQVVAPLESAEIHE
jgi:drug/metabolite transporter (DMT)-like permease